MNWNFLISFGVGLGVYLLVVLVWSLFKKHKIKKEIQHDDKVHEDEENKN